MGRDHGRGQTFITPVNPVLSKAGAGDGGRVFCSAKALKRLANAPAVNHNPFHLCSHFLLGPHTFLADAGAIHEHLR